MYRYPRASSESLPAFSTQGQKQKSPIYVFGLADGDSEPLHAEREAHMWDGKSVPILNHSKA
jgi:hypothetical protein